jgi:hypothetical protein
MSEIWIVSFQMRLGEQKNGFAEDGSSQESVLVLWLWQFALVLRSRFCRRRYSLKQTM